MSRPRTDAGRHRFLDSARRRGGRSAADQAVAAIDSEWTRVQATVQDTIQLRTWLRSLGPDAVVEEPESLRAQLKREWEELASLYEAPIDPSEAA